MLLFEVTYMSSLVWRSMGSWVSLSMWKRTSKDDSVSALNATQNIIHIRNYDPLNLMSWILSPYFPIVLIILICYFHYQ